MKANSVLIALLILFVFLRVCEHPEEGIGGHVVYTILYCLIFIFVAEIVRALLN